MTDAGHTTGTPVAQVIRWVHEAAHGQIQGFDGEGRVVLALTVGPQFAQRLASAFGASAPESGDPSSRFVNSASMLASVASSQARG